MSRIAIVGPGAVGGVIAAWLHQTGRHEITLCARRPLTELQVHTPAKTIAFAPRVFTDPAAVRPVDWALVTTKAYDASGAAAWLERLCARGAPAAILQNGVEHVERFAPYLPSAQILPVMIDCPAERADPLHITQRSACIWWAASL
jgi:2-dehydropantoate 2-reductase